MSSVRGPSLSGYDPCGENFGVARGPSLSGYELYELKAKKSDYEDALRAIQTMAATPKSWTDPGPLRARLDDIANLCSDTLTKAYNE